MWSKQRTRMPFSKAETNAICGGYHEAERITGLSRIQPLPKVAYQTNREMKTDRAESHGLEIDPIIRDSLRASMTLQEDFVVVFACYFDRRHNQAIKERGASQVAFLSFEMELIGMNVSLYKPQRDELTKPCRSRTSPFSSCVGLRCPDTYLLGGRLDPSRCFVFVRTKKYRGNNLVG